MGYYSERHGNKPETLSKSGRSYFRERHQDEIPNSESVLSRAAKIGRDIYGPTAQALGGAINTAGFGLPGVAVDKLAPEPIKKFMEPTGVPEQIGRGVGDIGGFMVGGPMKLAGKGAMKLLPKAGKFTRGAVEGAGSMASLSPSELATGSTPEHEALKVGGAGLLGGTVERAGNLFMKGAFRKNIKRQKMESLTENIGKIKEQVKNDPNATVDATDLWVKLNDIYDNLAGPVKERARPILRWINELEQNPIVHADKILQMEQELGAAAKFGGTKGGFAQFIKAPSPVANTAMKTARSEASSVYDKVAGKPFAEKSKKISSILKRYPDLDPSKGGRDWGERIGAGILGEAVSGSKGIGFGIYELARALQLPEVRQAIFKGLTSKSGKAITSGAKKSSVASLSEL